MQKIAKYALIFLHIFTYCGRLSEYDPSFARMSWRSHDTFSLTSIITIIIIIIIIIYYYYYYHHYYHYYYYYYYYYDNQSS
jgi:hypothetical protein